jgi:gas vesicle protein
MFRRADSGNRISLGGWRLRGFAVILLAAAIGLASVLWLGSSPNAAKTAPSQPAPLAQIAATAAVPPESTPLLQSISRDLISVGKEIEQLKAGRELMVRDNANVSEQLKASQEQLTRVVGGLSDQLKTGQEQAARDNANMAEQIKGIQDQLARVISQASEQKTLPKIAATSPRLAPRTPRPEGPAALKPVPTVSSAPVATKPKTEKPKLSSTTQPPAPAR